MLELAFVEDQATIDLHRFEHFDAEVGLSHCGHSHPPTKDARTMWD